MKCLRRRMREKTIIGNGKEKANENVEGGGER